jgi:hypothetical protein
MIAKIMTNFSGTALYIHMAISRYSNWFSENNTPRFVSGLSLFVKSTLMAFDIRYASGTRGAVKQNVSRFFVRMGRAVD